MRELGIPDRAAGLAARATRAWVAWYTRRLPPEASDRRSAEIESDLWEQYLDAARDGGERFLVGLDVARRLVAGVPADLSWRRAQLSAATGAALVWKETAMIAWLKRSWWLVLAGLLAAWALFVGWVLVIDPKYLGWEVHGVATGVVLLSGLLVRTRYRAAGDIMLVAGAVAGGLVAFWMILPPIVGVAIALAALADLGVTVRPTPPTPTNA